MIVENLFRIFATVKDAVETNLPESAPKGLILGFQDVKDEYLAAQIGFLEEECKKILKEYEEEKSSFKA